MKEQNSSKRKTTTKYNPSIKKIRQDQQQNHNHNITTTTTRKTMPTTKTTSEGHQNS